MQKEQASAGATITQMRYFIFGYTNEAQGIKSEEVSVCP